MEFLVYIAAKSSRRIIMHIVVSHLAFYLRIFDDFTISIIVLLIFITIIQIYIKIVLFYCNFRRVLKESYYPLPSSLAFRYVLKACSIASPLLFAEYAVHFFSLIPLVSLYMVTNKRIFLQSNY